MSDSDVNRWFWPTELAYRFRHCWTPNMFSYTPMPHKEHPPRPNRRVSRRVVGPKRVRLQRAPYRNNDDSLPF